jgi:hypothetical protein
MKAHLWIFALLALGTVTHAAEPSKAAKTAPGIKVLIWCEPAPDHICFEILWGLFRARGLFRSSISFDHPAATEDDCEPGEAQASCLFGFTNPNNPDEGIGWTNARVCYNPEAATATVYVLPETQEHRSYSVWRQACPEP